MDEGPIGPSMNSPSDYSSPLIQHHPAHFMDTHAYRDFYERRLQGLERFRRRVQDSGQQENEAHYFRLQSDLVDLMESDVNLMRQLMALGERIEELKLLTIFPLSSSESDSAPSSAADGISPASSMISLDGVYCEGEEKHDGTVMDDGPDLPALERPMENSRRVQGTNREETTCHVHRARIEIGEDASFVVADSGTTTDRVYFSRQNSVLRIPIPPSRAGIRSKTTSDPDTFGMRIRRGHGSACDSSSSDDTTSGASSVSEPRRGAGWYAKKKSGRTAVGGGQNGKVSKGEMQSATVSPYHISQGSCDSGVHHLNNSTECIKEDLIYV